MDDDFDGLLDSALDEFHSVHEEEEGKRQQRQQQRQELEALQRQKQEQERILQKLREQLQPTTIAHATTSSSSSSSSSTITMTNVVISGTAPGSAATTAPATVVQPDDLLDAALDDYADGERQALEAKQQPKPGTPSGPVDWDDSNLHHALEMFTTALGTLVEGSDEPEFAKLAATLSALAKEVGGSTPAKDDEVQMAKVLESVESLRKLVADDPELLQALEAAKAELSDSAPAAGSSPSAPAEAGAATDTAMDGVPEQFDMRALTSMLSILGDALKQSGLASDEKDEDVDHDTFETLVSKVMSPSLFLPAFQRLRDLYPQWIEQHRHSLSTEDSERYTKQLEKVREICDLCAQLPPREGSEPEVSGAAPEGSVAKRIWDCIEDMHQYGQPPAEILGTL